MRIVSCTPSTTEILILLGLANSVVGVDSSSAENILVENAETIGPIDNINVKQVSDLDPDLVIVTETVPGAEAIIQDMRESLLPILILSSERFDDLLSDVFTIAAECEVDDKAREIIDQIHNRIKNLSSQVVPRTEPVRAYFEWYPNPFVSAGKQSWISDMLHRSGAANLFDDFHESSLVPEEQEIIDRDPEVIFICWRGQGDEIDDMDADQILARKGWNQVSAIKKKQVHFLPESLFAFPGPRMLEGLDLLIQLIAQCESSSSIIH